MIYIYIYAYWRKTSQIRNRVSLKLMSGDVQCLKYENVENKMTEWI